RSAEEQGGMEPAVTERCRPINAAPKIDEFRKLASDHRGRAIAPMLRSLAGCEQRADAAGQRDSCPPCAARRYDRLPAERKTAIRVGDRRDRGRRRLGLGLT